MITATDLFAGAGGSTTGATQAGARVVIAANHWTLAVETHAANHPNSKTAGTPTAIPIGRSSSHTPRQSPTPTNKQGDHCEHLH